MKAVRLGIEEIANNLSSSGSFDAVEAIMTTDKTPKEIAVEIEVCGVKGRIAGIAKGSGMIHPNLATMIGIITTDIKISKTFLDLALKDVVSSTFNRVSVDGETSICDMVLILSNGQARNHEISEIDANYECFVNGLRYICEHLSKEIARDGEGATKLLEITADGASTKEDAYLIASTVAKSPLVKTAMFGNDANWGRIFTAVGYSGVKFDPNFVDIYIGNMLVCSNGASVRFDEAIAKKILLQREVAIKIDLKDGNFSDKVWTCDYSTDYIKINANYRT